jgi:hypothetical protein
VGCGDFVAIGFTPTGPAVRAADGALADCKNNAPDISIAGCTQVLARGTTETDSNRAVAFVNRGLAYGRKGDIDRAIGDFERAENRFARNTWPKPFFSTLLVPLHSGYDSLSVGTA